MVTAINIPGLGKFLETFGDFYQGLQALNGKVITPRDEAYARANMGESAIEHKTWTTAGTEYVSGELPILKLDSRLLNPKLAMRAFRENIEGDYLHTDTTKEYEVSLRQAEEEKSKEPIKRKVIILPSREPFMLSEEENPEVLEAILKDQALPYLEYAGQPITFSPLSPDKVNAQYGTVLTQMWFGFRHMDGGSVLIGDSRVHGLKK